MKIICEIDFWRAESTLANEIVSYVNVARIDTKTGKRNNLPFVKTFH